MRRHGASACRRAMGFLRDRADEPRGERFRVEAYGL
jgi:hypothetical protein